MARTTQTINNLECLYDDCSKCPHSTPDGCNPPTEENEVLFKTITNEDGTIYVVEYCDTGDALMYWIDPDGTKSWCAGTLEGDEVTSTTTGKDLTRETAEELYHDAIWESFSPSFKKKIMDNLDKLTTYEEPTKSAIAYQEYLKKWCENNNEDYGEVSSWLESTCTEEELADMGYLEEVLDKYYEGREE